MRSLYIFLFCLITTISVPGKTFGQHQVDFCSKASSLIKIIVDKHFQPNINDSSFLQSVFSEVLLHLDEHQLLFSESEYQHFDNYQYGVFDDIFNHRCQFYQDVINVYRSDLLQFQQVLHTSETFISNEGIDIDNLRKTLVASGNGIDRTNRWLLFLNELENDYIENQLNPSENSGSRIDYYKAFFQRENCKIDQLLDQPDVIQAKIENAFFKAISSAFDPHTNFLPFEEFQLFQKAISRQTFTFGISLKKNKSDEIEILKVIPGSNAWKSNQLNKGDVIIDILSEDIDFQSHCSKYEYLYNLFLDRNVDQVEMVVRKSGGEIEQVKLKKEKLEVSENRVDSYILDGVQKIGYLYLPGFYMDLESKSEVAGCADDVAREIVKLKKQGIKGFILDLRYNGGGSMDEALELGGIFINEGPLFVTKSHNDKPRIHKDIHRGTIYSGPMVVLVNRFSASASEVFASAMQDYNRAIIVGDTTFGKSTSQLILPLTSSDFSDEGDISFLKVTTDKLYRVTGKTYQGIGVVPDIMLPSLFGDFMPSEKDYDNEINSSPTDKKIYYTRYPLLPIKYLREKNNERMVSHNLFNQINSINDHLQTFKTNRQLGLKDENEKLIESIRLSFKQWEEIKDEKTEAYLVERNNDDLMVNSISEQQRAESHLSIENIYQDKYIEESYYILSDLINYLNEN